MRLPAVLLEFVDISYIRQRRPILKDVTWSVAPGEHAVVLGPNGSGKTTLLSMLNGLAAPSRGVLRCFGETYGASDWNRVKARIGTVSARVQNLIEPNQPVEWVVLSGKSGQINFWGEEDPADLAQAHRWLESWGIRALAQEPFGQLSQGERQRVLICRALMAQAELLILDEPCAGLDPVARKYLLDDVEALALAPGGPTLLLVTHHVEEIRPCFHQALLLGNGRMIGAGPIEQHMTNAQLSRMLNHPVDLTGRPGNWRLQLA